IATDSNFDRRLEASLSRFRDGGSQEVLRLLQFADLGVSGMRLSEQQMPEEVRERLKKAFEALELDHGNVDEFSLPPDVAVQHEYKGRTYDLPLGYESSGTRTWLSMLDSIALARSQG